MIEFLSAAAVLVAIALAFVLRPLLKQSARAGIERGGVNIAIYRDQSRELDADLQRGTLTIDQHAEARRELEARLLHDAHEQSVASNGQQPARRTAYALLALLPIGALAVYAFVGAPIALDPQVLADNAAAHAVDQGQLNAMVEKLAARLKEEPDNAEGWLMLARSYRLFKRYEESARAYGNAVSRLPPDASLLADYADVLGAAQGGLEGEPEKLISKALKIDPQNPKALALAGSAAFNRKNYAEAAHHWEQMIPLVPAASDEARAIHANVEEARGLAGITPTTDTASTPPIAPNARVSGVVQLAPELAGKVSPTDTVLIYARAAEGPRMPLAIVRKQVRELPVAFTLDDTMAMQPGMTLAKYAHVIVAARVSKSSNAAAQPGDLQGTSMPVGNTASNVMVVINSEVQ
ncbi:MAG: c-type cytochrome biogenesis protein CcmI [Burkholderiales bacterium]